VKHINKYIAKVTHENKEYASSPVDTAEQAAAIYAKAKKNIKWFIDMINARNARREAMKNHNREVIEALLV